VCAIAVVQLRINIFTMYMRICIHYISDLEPYMNEIPSSYILMFIVWINILYSITAHSEHCVLPTSALWTLCGTYQCILNTVCRLPVHYEHCVAPTSAFWTLCAAYQCILNNVCRLPVHSEHCVAPISAFWTLWHIPVHSEHCVPPTSAFWTLCAA